MNEKEREALFEQFGHAFDAIEWGPPPPIAEIFMHEDSARELWPDGDIPDNVVTYKTFGGYGA